VQEKMKITSEKKGKKTPNCKTQEPNDKQEKVQIKEN